MEGLIIMIIMIIVSSLFGKGKEQQKKESKQMPPFSSQPAPRKHEVKPNAEANRPKSLEDFASEIFGQLNEKAKPVLQKIEPQLPKQVDQPIVEETVQQVEVVNRRAESNNMARSLKERPIVAMARKEAEALQVVPSNQRDLMQAIIMTEVLGPPKAKRK